MRNIFTSLGIFFITSSLVAQGGNQSAFSGNKDIPKLDLHLQNPAPDKSKFMEDNKEGRALAFGYFDFDSKNLNSFLDTTSSVNSTFASNYMGISLDNFSNNGKHYDGISGVSFLIPQTVTAGTNDSLKLKMGGWHLTTSLFGYDIINGEIVTLAIAPAISWGNLKMRREVAGQKTKYTNPFVAPGGRVELRFTFGKISIGARATYRYDITKSLWKRKDDMMTVLPGYKNNGLAYFGYIGLTVGGKSNKVEKKLP